MSFSLHPTKNRSIPEDSARKWYQFDIGKRTGNRKRPVLFLTPTEAQAIHLELLRQPGQREPLSVSPTMKEALPFFTAWYRMEVSEGTMEDFTRVLAHLIPHFGPLRFHAIPAAVQSYKEKRLQTTYIPGRPAQLPEKDTPADAKKRKPISKKTINRELSYLRSIMKWAEDDERRYCDHGTVHRIGMFPKKKIPKVIHSTHSQGEISTILEDTRNVERYGQGRRQALYDHAAARYGLSLLMYHAGLRKKEARLILAEKVDLPPEPVPFPEGSGIPPYYGTITVTRKGGKVQRLPILTEQLYLELKDRKKAHPSGHLYVNPETKNPYIDIRGGLAASAQRTGSTKKINHHILRHDFITHLHEEGADMKTMQDLAGHAHIQTTMDLYTHVQTNTLRQHAAGFTHKMNAGTAAQPKARKK